MIKRDRRGKREGRNASSGEDKGVRELRKGGQDREKEGEEMMGMEKRKGMVKRKGWELRKG